MKFTADLPVGQISPNEFQSIEAVSKIARALEAANIDAGFVTDHPAPSAEWLHAPGQAGHDALDPFTALAFVAALSTRLKLHTNICVLPYRNPFITAKAAASLQVLSGGRLILGVGGGYQKVEFDALGVEFTKRGALMDEALEVLRLAWGGGVVVKQGRTFNAAGNEPRPAPDPQPLVWIGGGSDKAVERAAKWGDGWSPFFTSPAYSKNNQESAIQSVEQLGDKIKRVEELRAVAGKSGRFDVVIGPLLSIQKKTREQAEKYLEALDALDRVGVTWTVISPDHSSLAAYLDHIQWIGEELVAKAR